MAILFRNQQWKVEKCGMSAIGHGYFIERNRIYEARLSQSELFSWPLHMATKGWVDLDAFCEAFTHALAAYRPNHDQDMLQRLIEAALNRKAEAAIFSAKCSEMFPGKPALFMRDLEAVSDAIQRDAGVRA